MLRSCSQPVPIISGLLAVLFLGSAVIWVRDVFEGICRTLDKDRAGVNAALVALTAVPQMWQRRQPVRLVNGVGFIPRQSVPIPDKGCRPPITPPPTSHPRCEPSLVHGHTC
jgi:hypothetical protein